MHLIKRDLKKKKKKGDDQCIKRKQENLKAYYIFGTTKHAYYIAKIIM